MAGCFSTLAVYDREMEKLKLCCGIAVSETGFSMPDPDSDRIPQTSLFNFFQSLLKNVGLI